MLPLLTLYLVATLCSALTYVIVYPSRLNSCELVKSNFSVNAFTSIFLNTDSISTGGIDVATILSDSKVFKRMNVFVEAPEPSPNAKLINECSEYTYLIDEVTNYISQLMSNRSNLAKTLSFEKTIDDFLVLVNGDLLNHTFNELVNSYYYQGMFSPALVILPECANPTPVIPESAIVKDFYNFFQFSLVQPMKEAVSDFSKASEAIKRYLHSIAVISGIPDNDLVKADVDTYKELFISYFNVIIDELIKMPRQKFPRSLGKMLETIFTMFATLAPGDAEDHRRIYHNAALEIDEFYDEVLGFSAPKIFSETVRLLGTLNCNARSLGK